MTNRELEKSRKKNETLKREKEALKLVIEDLATQLDKINKFLVTKYEELQKLRFELQTCKAGRVHVQRQHAEFNAFSGFDSVNTFYFFFIKNR